MTSATVVTPPVAKPPRGRRGPRQGSVRGLVGLLVVLGIAALLSLAVGSRPIGPDTVLRVLTGDDGSEAATIIRELRVPRTVVAIAAGTCLGLAGTLMQGYTRNPLADPGLLGLTAGAAFAVVLGIFLLGVTSPAGYAWFALLGAGLAGAAVFGIGTTRRGPDPVTLVLAGTAVTALLQAVTNTILVRDTLTLDDYRFWIVGSVAGRDLSVLAQVAPFMAVGVLLAALCVPGLNLLQLGDDAASSLGLNPTLHKALGLAAVMLLCGAATAACGPIVFLGLTVPHVARHLAGVDHRWLVPYSAVLGAIVLVLADVLGRVLVVPAELQVGIVMALVGGPAFILLVRRARMVRL
ncbi:iron ABC transporter permease [Nocardioides sp. CFH 31398]|uniref:FecCD family ABC transporter permease n=1 Tax=Nocardioides sp. CFH 31398 TaxID=2919579 RepID=UPI001F06DC19|nr:iron ABC transporter permease [Nocardioides sp. CFH 31398]MCH1867886.1 iron ABC transporter permease [Nocardioides sp. CFH 31398]